MDRIGIAHRLVQLNPWLKNVVDFEDVDLDKVITTDQADKMKKEKEQEEEERIFYILIYLLCRKEKNRN